jgi:hypothetical protein
VIQTLSDGDSSKENQFVKFRNRYLFVYQNSVHASITEFNNRNMLNKLHVDSLPAGFSLADLRSISA